MDNAAAPAATAAQTTAVELQEPLASALDGIAESFFLMGAVRDPAGAIVDFEYRYCNKAALALLGCRREELIGRRLLELFPSHGTNGLFEAYAQVTETGEPLRQEFRFDEAGVTGEFEIVVSKADDGYLLAGHDISDRKQLERKVAALAEELQTALTSRILIEQAKGFVAGVRGVDPESAFDLIRRYARDNNLKLHDVCEAVLRGEVADLGSRPRT